MRYIGRGKHMNKNSSIELMSKMWNETKENMRNDNYEFTDIDTVIKNILYWNVCIKHIVIHRSGNFMN